MTEETKLPDAGATVDRIAETIGLDIDAAHRPGVVANFERVAGLAALVMAFELPDATELAAIFTP